MGEILYQIEREGDLDSKVSYLVGLYESNKDHLMTQTEEKEKKQPVSDVNQAF